MAATIKIPPDEHLLYIRHLRTAINTLEKHFGKNSSDPELTNEVISALEGLGQRLLNCEYDPDDLEKYKEMDNHLNNTKPPLQ